MKRIFFLIAIAFAALLAACATTGPVPVANLQQVATNFCPLVNADLKVLATSPAVSAPLQTQFQTLLTVNQGICAAGTGMTVTNLQDLNTKVVSAAIAILLANPTIPNQMAVVLALQIGQNLVNQTITQLQATTPPAAPAAPAVTLPAAPVKVS